MTDAKAVTSGPAEASNMPFAIMITCVAAIGGFLFGFDSGVINGTVEGLERAFNSDSIGTGFNVASMLLGCAVGAFFAGRLADIFGRRTLLIVAALFFIISALGAGFAASSTMFVLFRVLGGVAVGAASVISPAYISEIAPARVRGGLATLQQIAIITGLFSAFISNYLLAAFAGSATASFWLGLEAWRWMFLMQVIPASIFFFSLLAIPESPRYLVLRGKEKAARAALTRLIGGAAADAKVAEITASIAHDHRPRLGDLIDPVKKRIRPILWVGIGLATFQQLVGINVVFYYGAVLWQAVGFSETDALLINIISGGVSIIACIITIFVIDKIGRKPILWFGSVGMAVTLGLVTYAFANATMGEGGRLALNPSMGLLALIAANAYVFFFNGSWGPVMWVMLGEMFPNQIRGSGLAVSGLFQWLANFAITMTFPIMLTGVGLAGAYGFYTFCAVLSVFFVLKYVHETRGLELEQMQG